jgi:hypothetical protein
MLMSRAGVSISSSFSDAAALGDAQPPTAFAAHLSEIYNGHRIHQ